LHLGSAGQLRRLLAEHFSLVPEDVVAARQADLANPGECTSLQLQTASAINLAIQEDAAAAARDHWQPPPGRATV
jgi:hypothetical protein